MQFVNQAFARRLESAEEIPQVDCARMLQNLRGILAIELLCACQGIDLLAPLKTGIISTQAYNAVRAESPKVVEDRPLAQEINAVSKLIATETFSTLLR